MAWEAILQTNWRCAGGVPLTDLGVIDTESVITEQLDNRSGAVLQLRSEYYDVCKKRLVVMLIAEDGQWWEFRIDQLRRNHATTGFALELVPPWFDLESADIVREVVGSQLLEDFTETRTPADFIATRALANKAIDGIGWIGAGTCEFTKPVELSWSRLDRAAFLNLLPAAAKRGELQLRAVGYDGYVIDFVEAIGASLPTIPVLWGERLREQQSTVSFGDLYTAVRVFGESSGEQVARGANNVWRVSSVTALGAGSTAPFAVALRDPGDAAVSPIQLDGLFAIDPYSIVPACYLQLENGSRTVILQSRAATGDVIVAVAPTVGDMVSLVANAAGAPLDRIALPSAVAEHGLVIANARVPGGRTDRNYLYNPALANGLTDWSTPVGGIMTLVPRSLPPVESAVVDGGATTPSPAHFTVVGTAGRTYVRGDRVQVTGVALTTDADVIADADGELSVPLTAALTDDLPDGTPLVCPTLPSVAFYADGAGNLTGATTIAVRASSNFVTKPWLSNDRITVSTIHTPVATVSSVVNPFAQFVTVNIGAGFPYDRAAGLTVEWRDDYGASRVVALASDYVAGASTIELVHPDWIPFGYVPRFPDNGETLRFAQPMISVHTVSGTPTWNLLRRAAVTFSPGLPVAAPTALTTLSWARSGGAPVLGALTLVADAALGATSFTVQGDDHVSILPDASSLLVPATDGILATSVTLDGSGVGAIELTTAPASTPLDGAVVTISRHTEWAATDGGGANVALFESQYVYDDSAPTNLQNSPRSRVFTVVVTPGEPKEVVATVAWTFWTHRTVASPAVYAYGKIALVNADTNAVVAWMKTEPENADALTSPDNARLPLVFDAALTRWQPLHVRLQCNVILTATTRLQLRCFAPTGFATADRARGYFRWAVVHVPGMTDVTYFAGSLDNAMVLTAAELLARDARPAETFDLELADIDAAAARAAELPADAVAPVRLGSTLSLEESGTQLRVITVARTPNRRTSRVTVGTRRASPMLTLAATAVVTLGGAR